MKKEQQKNSLMFLGWATERIELSSPEIGEGCKWSWIWLWGRSSSQVWTCWVWGAIRDPGFEKAVNYMSLEVRREIWAGDTYLWVISIKLDVITKISEWRDKGEQRLISWVCLYYSVSEKRDIQQRTLRKGLWDMKKIECAVLEGIWRGSGQECELRRGHPLNKCD